MMLDATAGPATLLAMLATGYVVGSVPFGLLLTQMAGFGDIRSMGSGNIGATNVLRTGNKSLAAATLLLDALKATLAVLVGWRWGLEPALAAYAGAMLGHCFPIWLGFKGGKGVATFLGGLIGLAWPAGLAFIVIWIAVAVIGRRSSLSALAASVAAPAVLAVTTGPLAAIVTAGLAALLWIRHRSNIARLLEGTEPRIGAKADATPTASANG